MEENFKLYSQYYDLLYTEKDYDAEAKYITDLIKNYMPTAKSLLELGSGTGKHAKIFALAGYQVLGIERSAEMVEIAQKDKTENLSFQIADIIDFKTDQKFDVALSLFHVISYITENENLIKIFNQTHQHLNEDGLFIFDVWHSSAVNHQKPEQRKKIWEDQKIHVTRKATPTIYSETNIVNVNYDIQIEDLITRQTVNFKEDHPMRHFCKSELELLAYATGFQLLHTEEWLTKKDPSVDTWGVTYILRKF